jgi:CxxC motif-containing protein (DUF1111 family)
LTRRIGSGPQKPARHTGSHAFLLVATLTAACAPGREVAREPGQPLAGLTEEERGRFLLGKALFERLTTPEEGLGPLYNAERCRDCHSAPAPGGSGPALVVKATRFEDGRCDLLTADGGDNVQQRATAPLLALGINGERIPARATATAKVTGPPLFGLGLVEAVPERLILAGEDPDDADGDGVSGRVARTADGRLGRFGRKGEAATLADFIDTALRFELGLTTPSHPREETVNGKPLPPGADPAPDPEIDGRGVRLLVDYVRFLAPPARAALTQGPARDEVRRGETLFAQIGCAKCHTPVFRTARTDAAALSRAVVRVYSDLLLHDLGAELADVCGPSAAPSEYRTATLWGLRFREALLHDGRARTVVEAIAFHGGEATAARAAFGRLTSEERAVLLAFLESL